MYDISPTVIIDVVAYTYRAARGCIDANFAAHVGKRPVTVVAKQLRLAALAGTSFSCVIIWLNTAVSI
jgi:hypothetical protein